MTEDQLKKLASTWASASSANRKLRKLAAELFPVGSTVAFPRGDSIVHGTVRKHAESVAYISVTDTGTGKPHRVTISEIIEYQRGPRT
ncbi:hypothetical protein LH464_04295 [Neorhizobium sp. T786]|uniref:hypothetical protein n=1 Tax=Pseudorhizobium xiangyangii TaxID=2883104 RepID=UPI001CFFF09F|nr:hypothetical protein [Neorhizobium xiangyangii]MCB5201698.1 hypothetical protein [Neorhizobium xiangyangii]